MTPDPVGGLLAALAGGSARIVDLTQPLSEHTPVIRLPEPFANTPPLSRRSLSRYDDAGPAWAWDVLELGEHTGTADPLDHRARRRGRRLDSSRAPRWTRRGHRPHRGGCAEPRLPADRRRPRGLGSGQRPDPGGRLDPLSHRLGRPRAGCR